MDKTLSVSEAKMKLNRLVDEVVSKEDEFVLTRNGKPVAALVPAALYEGWKETQAIKADLEFLAEIRRGIDRLHKRRKRYSFGEAFREPDK
jgi:prevent-host-death family protein